MSDRAAYLREHRLILEREGVCTMCASREPGREPRPGLRTCAVCAQGAAVREARRPKRYTPTGKLGRPRRGQDHFHKPGVCSRCSCSVLPGRDVCAGHAQTLLELARESAL